MLEEVTSNYLNEEELENEFKELVKDISTNVLRNTIIRDGDYVARKLEQKMDRSVDSIHSKNLLFLTELRDIKNSTASELKNVNESVNNTYIKVKNLLEENTININNKISKDIQAIANNFDETTNKSKTDLMELIKTAEVSLKDISDSISQTTQKSIGACEESANSLIVSVNKANEDISNLSKNISTIVESTNDFNKNVREYSSLMYKLDQNVLDASKQYSMLVDQLRKDVINLNTVINNKNQHQIKRLNEIEDMLVDMNVSVDIIEELTNKNNEIEERLQVQESKLDIILTHMDIQDKKREKTAANMLKIQFAFMAIVILLFIFAR